jgi:hypothetical protein
MKIKTIIIMITIAMAASICVSCTNPSMPGGSGGTGAGTDGVGGSGMIVGNGNLITSERAVSGFEKISSSGSADIRFHVSQEYRVFVTVDSNIDEYVEVRTSNSVLTIGLKSGSYRLTKWIIDVYCPLLTGISLSGSSNFKSVDKLTVSAFDAKITGSGDIDAALECNTFYANISGSGTINISGSSSNSNIHITGSGDFNGYNFVINNATVNIAGSGEANIYVTNNLNAIISGSGEINNHGNPVINSTITGSGRIRQR